MRAAVHHGGCLLAGYEGEQLVAMTFGFLGGDYLVSHIAAVHPEFQGRGLGEQLKRAQFEWARQRGLRRITWTFDPLQGPNARLNLVKLGAWGARYYVDFYGQLDDQLNCGQPTDRLEVDWWIEPPALEIRPEKLTFPWPDPGRLHSRPLFQEALAQGLVVTDFHLAEGQAHFGLARPRHCVV